MRHSKVTSLKSSRGSTLAIVIAVGGLVVSSATGVMILSAGLAKYRPAPAPRPHASAVQLRVVLHQLGLTPENLAASGATPERVSTLVADVATDLDTSFPAITDARNVLANAKVAKDTLIRAIQSGQATAGQRNGHQAVLSTFHTAELDLQSLMDGVWTRATTTLNEAQRQTIQTIRANAAWDISTQYLVTTRTEADWVHLRDAWSADRFAKSRQEQTPPQATAILDIANADTAVSTATSNLAALATIRAAWENAVTANGDLP